MKAKRILATALAVTLIAVMMFEASVQISAAAQVSATEGYPQEAPAIPKDELTFLTNEQLEELIKNAPCKTETRSAQTLANRRITESELATWIEEYWELGGISGFELEVVRLINIEREKYNLQPLKINPNLMMAARFHSQQMADLNFFSHRSPHHGRGIYRAEMFGHENIQEHVWGVRENIAGSIRSPQAVVQAWMNSPGHRAAILGDVYLTIGVGAVQGGGTTAKFGS